MSAAEIDAVLEFWFADRERDELTVDSRMACWFGGNAVFDAELTDRFSGQVKRAFAGELDDWANTPTGRLALILLLGQFPRHIHKHSKQAFRGDRQALKLCQQGVADDSFRALSTLQQMFFFMPLQRIESLKIQETSVKIYAALSRRVSDTMYDTFETVAQFAELRRDIIEEFGRFPHRNEPLGRANSGAEESYLTA